jgi:uncharacterized membrane protein
MKANQSEDESKHWKLKLFYFNNKDKRTIVPGRIPYLGPTLNLANPKVLFFLLGVFVILLLMLFVKDYLQTI